MNYQSFSQNSFDFERLPMQQFCACVIAYLTSVGYIKTVFRSRFILSLTHTFTHNINTINQS